MPARTVQDLYKKCRRPGDIVFALVFLMLAGFLFTRSGDQIQVTRRTPWFAQPGLWPNIAIYGMLFFGALHLLIALISPRIRGHWLEVAFWLRSLEFVAYFLIYVKMVPWLGYLPSTLLFTVLLTRRCGVCSKRSLVMVVSFAVLVVLLFRGFLDVRIPAGQLYEFLPFSIRTFAVNHL